MPTGTGLDAQIGYAAEDTLGTPETVTRFLPLLNETLDGGHDWIESQGIVAGRTMQRATQRRQGNVKTEGSVQHELYTTGLGLLFKEALGTVNITGTGPYVQLFTPGPLGGLGMTVQVGVPTTEGPVEAKTMTGAKIAKLTMKDTVGDTSKLDIDLVGMDISWDEDLAVASYPSGFGLPFVGHEISVTIGGVAVCVQDISTVIENPFAERRCLGSQGQREPLQNAYRVIGGDMQFEFENMTQYNRVLDATEAAVVITRTSGAFTLVQTMHCGFDGGAPSVSGTDIVNEPLSFKCLSTGADSTAFSMAYTTTDALAA